MIGQRVVRARCHIGVQVKGSVANGLSIKKSLNDRGNCKAMEVCEGGILVTLLNDARKIIPYANMSEIDLDDEAMPEPVKVKKVS
jgi:hypothetical protein